MNSGDTPPSPFQTETVARGVGDSVQVVRFIKYNLKCNIFVSIVTKQRNNLHVITLNRATICSIFASTFNTLLTKHPLTSWYLIFTCHRRNLSQTQIHYCQWLYNLIRRSNSCIAIHHKYDIKNLRNRKVYVIKVKSYLNQISLA